MTDDFESAPCGLVIAAADGTIQRVNTVFVGMTGTATDDLIGRRFTELLDAGSRLFYETRCLSVLQLTGEALEVSLAIRQPAGSALPVLVNLSLDDSGLRIAVFDSTQRRDYERQLLETQRAAELAALRVQVLQDASASFGVAETEKQLSDALVAIVRRAFAAPFASVAFVTSDGLVDLISGESPLDRDGFERSDYPESSAIESRRVASFLTVDGARAHSRRLADAMAAARIESLASAPLLDEDTVLGAVTVYFTRQRDRDPQGADLFAALARQAAQVLKRIRLQNELTRLALHDSLTGLANRELLGERLTQALAASARHSTPIAALFLDLDGFKAVNDTLGHPVGDTVLQEVAVRLRDSVRAEDTIGRIGGDEFVILWAEADAESSRLVAERIREAIARPFDRVAGLPISASIGIALGVATSETTGAEVLGIADVAMYESKRGGRDRVTITEF